MFAKSAHILSRLRAYPPALLPLVLSIVVCLSWGVKARGWMLKPAALATPLAASTQNRSTPSPAMALTTLNRFGFEPSEVSVPEGDCVIVIRDAFGSDESNFLIADLNETRA